jgi:hypothetical protein
MAYARVATFEGSEPEQVRKTISEIEQRASDGPPEGVPSNGFLMLRNDQGKALAIALFDTEDDMRKGDETLNQMTPPGEGMGQRTSLEFYEVGVKVGPALGG